VLSSTFCCTISPVGSAIATFNDAPSTDNVLEAPDELATRFSEAKVSVTFGSAELIDPPVSTTGELDDFVVWNDAIPSGKTAKTLASPLKFIFMGETTELFDNCAGMLTT